MNNEQEIEIDLIKFIGLLLRKWYVLAVSAILAGAIAFGFTFGFVVPKYTASVLMYVNNSSISVGSQSISISSTQISAAKNLVDTYCIILKTRLTLEEVISKAGLNYSYNQLSGMISAGAVNNTEIFKIEVTSTSPQEACLIANTIVDVLPGKISSIVEGSSVRTVDMAVVPTVRSSPSYSRNTAIGMIIGFVLAAAVILLKEFLNDTIDSEDWLLTAFNNEIPLLSVIPNLDSKSGEYGYNGYASHYYTSSKGGSHS